MNEEKYDSITSSLTQNNMSNSVPNLRHLQSQQRSKFGSNTALNMLGNALMQPKRKRGRPRKLSGSSNGPSDDFDRSDSLVQGSPEMLEVKMGMDGFGGNNSDSSCGKAEGSGSHDLEMDIKDDQEKEPVAGTSKEQFNHGKGTDGEFQPAGKW